jgi:hypothetical protein
MPLLQRALLRCCLMHPHQQPPCSTRKEVGGYRQGLERQQQRVRVIQVYAFMRVVPRIINGQGGVDSPNSLSHPM